MKNKKRKYVRRLKSSDYFLDFDPFDHPYGTTPLYYPKVTPYLISKYKYGIFEHGGSNICYSFGTSKRKLKFVLEKWINYEKEK